MSKCKVCDVCGRTTKEIRIGYFRRATAWFKICGAHAGVHDEKLDVCDSCWDKFRAFCKKVGGEQ